MFVSSTFLRSTSSRFAAFLRRCRPFISVGLFLLASCLHSSGVEEVFRAVPISVLEGQTGIIPIGEVEVLGALHIIGTHPDFGGLSGMIFDGQNLTAITDRGHYAHFEVKRDAEGRPLSVKNLTMGRLGGIGISKVDSDSEEIISTPDGPLVSFERRHRLFLYPDGLSEAPQELSPPPDFSNQPKNGGVEALVRLRDGKFLLLSEYGKTAKGRGKAWLGTPGDWAPLGWARDEDFGPTSVALLPNGDLLVLERGFSFVSGFSSRLLRVPAQEVRPGNLMKGRVLAVFAPPFLSDNYEGLAVLQRPDGRTVAYILSDDNFFFLQRTLLLTVLIP